MILILLLFTSLSFLRLELYGQLVVLVYLAASAYAASNKDWCRRGSNEKLLGVLIPTAPVFGSGTLLTIILIFLIRRSKRISWKELYWAAPIFAVVGSWVIADTIWGHDPEELRFLYNDAGSLRSFLGVSRKVISRAPPAYLLSWENLARYFALFMSFSIFSKEDRSRSLVFSGMKYGMVIAALALVVQLFGGLQGLFVNQNQYWSSLERYTGTFSDPNAFGVFVALLIPFILAVPRKPANGAVVMSLVLGSSWLILGVFSGSRTYFLALFILLCGYLLNRSRKIFWAVLLLTAVGIGAVNVCLEIEGLQAFLVDGLPVGLRRIIWTVHLASIKDAFFSRAVFSEIAWRMWLGNPIWGAGFNHFRDALYNYSADLNISTWTDNANNFYLGILAETGVVGFLAFLISCSNLVWKKGSREGDGSHLWICKLGVVCLLVLLLTGPHLEFDEVNILAALIFSGAITVRVKKKGSIPSGLIYIAIFGSIVCLSYFSERGFYRLEDGDAEGWFRWSSRKALLRLTCNRRGKAFLKIRALHPDLSEDPVGITFSTVQEISHKRIIRSTSTKLIKLPCRSGGRRSEEHYFMEVSRPWIPATHGLLEDWRLLGVQVFLHDNQKQLGFKQDDQES